MATEEVLLGAVREAAAQGRRVLAPERRRSEQVVERSKGGAARDHGQDPAVAEAIREQPGPPPQPASDPIGRPGSRGAVGGRGLVRVDAGDGRRVGPTFAARSGTHER